MQVLFIHYPPVLLCPEFVPLCGHQVSSKASEAVSLVALRADPRVLWKLIADWAVDCLAQHVVVFVSVQPLQTGEPVPLVLHQQIINIIKCWKG